MPRRKKKKSKVINPKHEAAIKKIKKIYENYGINTNDMSEDELNRLYRQYVSTGKNLDEDLKESEKFSSVFEEDII